MAVSAAVTVLLLAASCGFLYWTCPIVRTELEGYWAPNVEEVQERAGLIFPPDARLLGSRHYVWWDGDLAIAKVRVSRPDAEEFLSRLASHCPVSRQQRPHFPNSLIKEDFRNAWWRPEEAEEFVAGEFWWRDGRRRHVAVLVQLDDPAHAVIYVSCDGLD